MRRAALLVGLLALAAIPRLLHLDQPGLTYDEFYDIEDSRRFCELGRPLQPISDGFLNGQAPFFLACLLEPLATQPESVPRALSVLAGLLSVALTYGLARRLLPSSWALLAAAMLAFSPWFVAASRLAFSHGHVFAVPWLLLSLRATLSARHRLARPTLALLVGATAGFAVGNDLLAAPWTLTVLLLALRRLSRTQWARWTACFVGAWLLGLTLASPMYVVQPLRAIQDVLARIAWWDGQTGHLWLGVEQQHLPLYYYPLVLVVRLSPPVVLLLVVAAFVRRSLALRVAWPCLWPVLLLTFKGWKSPFYLTPFLPLIFIMSAAALHRLARAGAAWRPRTVARLGTATVIAAQLALLLDSHPDHLMTGIRYGERTYGDFAGPAVSHGQWVRAALEHVRRDARRDDSVVLVPLGYAPRQIDHYASRLGLLEVHSADRLRHGVHPRQVEYVVVSHDVLAHADGLRFNQALLRLLTTPGLFEPLATVRSAGFPMARVWRRTPPRS